MNETAVAEELAKIMERVCAVGRRVDAALDRIEALESRSDTVRLVDILREQLRNANTTASYWKARAEDVEGTRGRSGGIRSDKRAIWEMSIGRERLGRWAAALAFVLSCPPRPGNMVRDLEEMLAEFSVGINVLSE